MLDGTRVLPLPREALRTQWVGRERAVAGFIASVDPAWLLAHALTREELEALRESIEAAEGPTLRRRGLHIAKPTDRVLRDDATLAAALRLLEDS